VDVSKTHVSRRKRAPRRVDLEDVVRSRGREKRACFRAERSELGALRDIGNDATVDHDVVSPPLGRRRVERHEIAGARARNRDPRKALRAIAIEMAKRLHTRRVQRRRARSGRQQRLLAVARAIDADPVVPLHPPDAGRYVTWSRRQSAMIDESLRDLHEILRRPLTDSRRERRLHPCAHGELVDGERE
jgi:hypothetical protein